MNYRPGDMVIMSNADGIELTGQIIEINTDNGDVTVRLETGALITYTPIEFMSSLEDIW